jgi:hypothetical protein
MAAPAHRALASCLLTALVLATSACGGGGDEAKKTYIQSANAVCARTYDRVRALPAISDAPGVVAHLQQLAAILRDQADALHRLSPPRNDLTTIEGMIAQIELASANLAAAATAKTQRDDSGAVAANARALNATRNANNIAVRYGLNRCGSQVKSTSP